MLYTKQKLNIQNILTNKKKNNLLIIKEINYLSTGSLDPNNNNNNIYSYLYKQVTT